MNRFKVDGKEKREVEMAKIAEEVINLTSSPLFKERIENNYLPVIGEGSLFSKIMFIGEAPGKNEAKTGKPFCGASGRILNDLLKSIDLVRESVYITSVLKDRPGKNRDPKPEEIKIYSPFLDRQIEIIKPAVIVTLGRFSASYILERFGFSNHTAPISKIHGQVFEVKNSPFVGTKIVTLYHPAFALYNGSKKKILHEDFKVLRTLV